MTAREKALAVIHLEFTRLRAQNPYLSVREILSRIKMPHREINFRTRHNAKRDYQRDAQKMYEQGI